LCPALRTTDHPSPLRRFQIAIAAAPNNAHIPSNRMAFSRMAGQDIEERTLTLRSPSHRAKRRLLSAGIFADREKWNVGRL